MFPLLQVTDERLTAVCGDSPDRLCELVFDATGSELAADLITWLLSIALPVGLIFLGALLIDRLVRTLIGRMELRLIENSERPDRVNGERVSRRLRARARTSTISGVLRNAGTVIIFVLAGITVLAEIGIAVAPLLAGAGAVGIAIAFGAQKLVADFLSGIFILSEDQYGLNDWIDTGFCIGQVEAVSLRTTRVRDVEGTLWHIPNGEIRRIGNMSQEWARTLLDIDVAYATDMRRATVVIEDVCLGLWEDPAWQGILVEQPEVWGVQKFGTDGISIRLGLKTEPSQQWQVGRELRLRLKEAFDAEGIEIPLPQRSVWLRNGEGPFGRSREETGAKSEVSASNEG